LCICGGVGAGGGAGVAAAIGAASGTIAVSSIATCVVCGLGCCFLAHPVHNKIYGADCDEAQKPSSTAPLAAQMH
jgi:hypothetical protein